MDTLMTWNWDADAKIIRNKGLNFLFISNLSLIVHSVWTFLTLQAVMRHYIGKKHGILDKFVKEELAQIRKENGGKIPGAVITPTIEVQL